jgi:RNA-binding protein
MGLTSKDVQAKRAEAQALRATLHVGKAGVTDATIAELDAQLRKSRLVKVRLLPTAAGTDGRAQAGHLAVATASTLVEVRGHTAVLFR